MKKFQKEVISKTLDAEKKILSDLQKQYSNAENDINRKIEKLLSRRDASSVYVQNQVKFLTGKKGEVTQILNNLKTKQYDSVQNYLKGSYEDGFMGTMYSLQKQGIPLVFPIDQKDVLKALTVNSKLSSKLYNALGVSVSKLKTEIRNELAIGLAQGNSYQEIAKKISMSSGSGLNNAYRIARTEGARVNQESKMDAMMKSKKAGADIVKTWDSTLDGRTRPHHQELNGQTREIDEPFEVAGRQAMNPCGFGVASEDINCRCTVLEEARWESKDKSFKTKYDGLLEGNGRIANLKDCTTFEQFKQKYQTAVNETEKDVKISKVEERCEIIKAIENSEYWKDIDYLDVQKLSTKLSTDEIVDRLSGGDMTGGSCSSLGFAYIGNKNGLDVLDFRGGKSREFFSNNNYIQDMLKLPNVKGSIIKVKNTIPETMKIINSLEYDKEYYLAVGRHVSIIKNTKKGAEYLELQSKFGNGWTSFSNNRYGTMYETLNKRFGCRKTVDKMRFSGKTVVFEKDVVLMDVDSFKDNEEFKDILGYLNTAVDKQKKGVTGGIK